MGDGKLNLDELSAFNRFAEVAALPIVDGSVQTRFPPEPDILCQLSSGEYVGFEVTEACNPKNIRFAKNAMVLGRDLSSAYQNLPPDFHKAFRTRFAGHAISVAFEPEVGRSKARRTIPKILVALLNSSHTSDGWFLETPAQFPGILQHIRFAGRYYEPDDPTFNIAGSFDPSDMTVDAVRRKLSKKYVTSYPIELVVFFGGWAAHFLDDWRNVIPELLRQNGGTQPFRRIWIFGGDKIQANYGT